MKSHGGSAYLLAAFPAAFLLLFFALPILLLLSTSVLKSEDMVPVAELTTANFSTLLTKKLYLDAILRTIGIGVAVGFTVLCNACRERWWHFSVRWRDRQATYNIPAASQRSRPVEAVPSEELRCMAERLDSQLKRGRALGSVNSGAA